MLGLALGAVLSSTNSTDATAQVPRNISYQGQLLENNQAATGAFTITLNYYTAGGSTPIYTETFSNVPVENGIFNVILGSNGGFPASMDFNEQYFVGVQVNGGQELTPRTAMLASPYALNANAVNGFTVSDLPAAGQLLVLDANGRVPQSALPASPTFVAGNNITIQQDSSSNTYIFSSTGGQSSGITGVTVGNGLIGGGTSGEIQINLAPNGITTDMIAPGAITGTRLSPTLAGEGLYQDILGNLNVGVDGSSIVIRSDDRLAIGTIGGSNIDSTIQRRITGVATPGTFITGVNPNGTITSGTIATDSSLTRTVNGSDLALGLNPTYSNTFTAPQNFDVINANTVNTQTLNADMVMTDDLMAHGNIMFGNGITNGNVTFNTGTGVISLSGATLQNVGTPINGTDAVNRNYVDSAFATQALGGDISGPNGANTLNLTNPGIGDRLVTGINSGTTTVNDPAINDTLTINSGTINNTPIGTTGASSGMFTTLSSTGQTDLATATDRVVIGTSAPTAPNNTILEIERPMAEDLMARIYNSGAGGAELRLAGADGVQSTLSFTDDSEWVSSINSNDAVGMTFNMRDVGDVNSEAAMDAATVMTIERDGDVVINEDLTVLGAVNFGNGDDNLTFNSGTGTVDFSGSRLTNVADPVNNMDAVNLQSLNNAITAATPAPLAGDITGPNGANTLDVTNPGIGDRLVTGVNSGTTTINDPAVADNLTIDGGTINNTPITGGTIDNTPIGATTASTGNFTTLTSSEQTNLANTTGNVLIGSGTSFANDALLEVTRATADPLLVRVFNTGAGGTDIRLTGATAAPNTISFTDMTEYVSSIVSDADQGLNFNVRDLTDANTEAGLAGATAMTIERDRDVVIYEDLTVGGELIANSAADFLGVSTRYADTYVVPAPGGSTIVVPNALVTPNSTVIVTYEANTGTTPRGYTVQTDATGSFTVIFDAGITAGDEIHYIIINH